jgi:hypothetical protein
MEWIDLISFNILIPITLLLGFAPFFPRPHIYEKLSMLKEGTLKKPLDIFDLLYHLSPFVLLLVKVVREIST